jgi:hypothetical protein
MRFLPFICVGTTTQSESDSGLVSTLQRFCCFVQAGIGRAGGNSSSESETAIGEDALLLVEDLDGGWVAIRRNNCCGRGEEDISGPGEDDGGSWDESVASGILEDEEWTLGVVGGVADDFCA